MGHAQFPSLDGRPGMCGPTGQTKCDGTICSLPIVPWPEFKYGKPSFREAPKFDLIVQTREGKRPDYSWGSWYNREIILTLGHLPVVLKEEPQFPGRGEENRKEKGRRDDRVEGGREEGSRAGRERGRKLTLASFMFMAERHAH